MRRGVAATLEMYTCVGEGGALVEVGGATVSNLLKNWLSSSSLSTSPTIGCLFVVARDGIDSSPHLTDVVVVYSFLMSCPGNDLKLI